ncbi:hypothetical protein KY289_026438 [Solanum tuberosum]|nr:hypothetical protein KY289_026438 [Solanum tuberosum]
MVNAQELEAHRLRFGLKAETVAIDENIAVDGIIPPHRQPIAPRGRGHHPAHIMYEVDDADLDGVGATEAIVLPTLPPGMFRGATGDDAN